MRTSHDIYKRFLSSVFIVIGLVGLAACTGEATSPLQGRSGTNTSPAFNESTLVPSEWVGSWSAAPYGPFPNGPLSSLLPVDVLSNTSYFPNNEAQEQSFRMIISPTASGEIVRLRFSNLKGSKPVTLEPVTLAKRLAGPALVPGSETTLTFRGQKGISIPVGEEVISDAVPFKYSFGESLAVSFRVKGNSGPMTWHAVSFGLNYISLPGRGDVTADPSGVNFSQVNTGWFFLSGLDVYSPDSNGAVVTLGDSITDGAYVVPETNTRWPDFVAQKLNSAGIQMAILNQGINSNTVTSAAIREGEIFKGPSAEERFDRDVLGRSGVKTLILFEGTNDLGAGLPAEEIFAGIQRIANRAKSAGLCVYLGTIMPRADVALGWNPSTMEPQRRKLNQLIRSNNTADGVIDFESALASPIDPNLPNPIYFFPDLLHPNSVGFSMMANKVPVNALSREVDGSCTQLPKN